MNTTNARAKNLNHPIYCRTTTPKRLRRHLQPNQILHRQRPLLPPQHCLLHNTLPLPKPLLLTKRRIRLHPILIGHGPGPVHADDGPLACGEEEVRPGEDPEESEVEEEADPLVEAPGVDAVGGVQFGGGVGDGEGYAGVAAVICAADEGLEGGLEIFCVET